jgi:hypothetical protein
MQKPCRLTPVSPSARFGGAGCRELGARPGRRPDGSGRITADIRRENRPMAHATRARPPMGAAAAIGVIVLAIAALGSARHARAQGAAQSAGRQALQAACGADYKRLCPNVFRAAGGSLPACAATRRNCLRPARRL